jgi:cell division protein FtsQ
VKKFWNISLWITGIVIVTIVLGFANRQRESAPCRKIVVNINQPDEVRFVERKDIYELINVMCDSSKKLSMSDINISMLEKMVRNHPYVSEAEVYSTIDGTVRIDVTQRRPVVRIYNALNQSYYLDEKGKSMPLSSRYVAHVPVASGNIDDSEGRDVIPNAGKMNKRSTEKVFRIASFMHQDSLWSAMIEQIYVNEKGEMELIPKLGSHQIMLGDTTDLRSKFTRLELIYREGMKRLGWDNYSLINLKYNHQVVCTKKEQE